MGFRAVAAVLHHSQAKGTTKLVLLALANFHDDKGDNGAFPSQEMLARLSNCSVRNVQRCLHDLEQMGEIETVIHGGKGKTFDRQTNRYFIRLDCPDNCDASLNHRDLDDVHDRLTRSRRPTYTKWASDSYEADVVLTVKNYKEPEISKLRALRAV